MPVPDTVIIVRLRAFLDLEWMDVHGRSPMVG
jgi:hypothetical protein